MLARKRAAAALQQMQSQQLNHTQSAAERASCRRKICCSNALPTCTNQIKHKEAPCPCAQSSCASKTCLKLHAWTALRVPPSAVRPPPPQQLLCGPTRPPAGLFGPAPLLSLLLQWLLKSAPAQPASTGSDWYGDCATMTADNSLAALLQQRAVPAWLASTSAELRLTAQWSMSIPGAAGARSPAFQQTHLYCCVCAFT